MIETPDTSASLGRLLRNARHRAALTEQQLAEACHVTRQTVIAWEHSRKLPKLAMIRDKDGGPGPLALALDVEWKRLAKARARDEHARWRRKYVECETAA